MPAKFCSTPALVQLTKTQTDASCAWVHEAGTIFLTGRRIDRASPPSCVLQHSHRFFLVFAWT